MTFLPSGQAAQVKAGTTLLQAAIDLGLPLRHVCGGQANCTTCRVHVQTGAQHLSAVHEREQRRLPDQRLSQGWRLACQTRSLAEGAVVVRIPSLVEWIRLAQQEGDSDV